MTLAFTRLITDARNCKLCQQHLPDGVRPIVQIQPRAKLLIIGQAPGRKVHESGIPFNDASGERLREWLGINPGQDREHLLTKIKPFDDLIQL